MVDREAHEARRRERLADKRPATRGDVFRDVSMATDALVDQLVPRLKAMQADMQTLTDLLSAMEIRNAELERELRGLLPTASVTPIRGGKAA